MKQKTKDLISLTDTLEKNHNENNTENATRESSNKELV